MHDGGPGRRGAEQRGDDIPSELTCDSSGKSVENQPVESVKTLCDRNTAWLTEAV
jgi:hypothetical protein